MIFIFVFIRLVELNRLDIFFPTWLDKFEEVLPDPKEWRTCIRLPIQRTNRLQENFEQIQGKLLLFLNRLRRIEIVGQLNNCSNTDQSRSFARIDHADGKIIELQEKTINGTIIQTSNESFKFPMIFK